MIFEGEPSAVSWEREYHRIAGGVVLLDLVLFVDQITGTLDAGAASEWLSGVLVKTRLAKARAVAVDLPEWRTIDPSVPVLAALVRTIAAVMPSRRTAGLKAPPVTFYGLTAHAWDANYRAAVAAYLDTRKPKTT
ncbi:MAG: hypothetical protein VB036_18755 [Propionicimonas sp.]|nr:hypothetical protein [Propionicimonas sp.]